MLYKPNFSFFRDDLIFESSINDINNLGNYSHMPPKSKPELRTKVLLETGGNNNNSLKSNFFRSSIEWVSDQGELRVNLVCLHDIFLRGLVFWRIESDFIKLQKVACHK